jgi:LysR family transcriptional regulator, transcriptional activator of the cysJI operon
VDHQLLTFVTVVEKQSFTKASDSLHITQAAVTQSIKTLESKYGTQLLNRTNKYVRLTKAGEILYHHAKEIIANYEHVSKLIDDLTHSAKGPISIGSSFTFGEYLLPGLISEFRKTYPLIMPSISIRNSKRILMQLEQHELDIGIVEGKIEHPSLMIHPFAHDEMVIVVPKTHRLADVTEVDLEELGDETWILREEGSGTRQTINSIFQQKKFSPATTMSFGSSQIIKESVEAELGISILSLSVLRKELLLNTLSPIRIKNTPIKRNYYYVIHNTKFQTKSLQLFAEFLNGCLSPPEFSCFTENVSRTK